MIKFNLLICDKTTTKHKYNLTPLSKLIINDLVSVYKSNFHTFEHLNKMDKKTSYDDIRKKIADLKKK